MTNTLMSLFANLKFAPHPLLDGTHFSKKILISGKASNPRSSHSFLMLTELYIEVLLVDEELADLVWEAWDAGLI